MKLECDVIRDLLPLYAEKLASPASSALVEQHLAACPACRAELEQMEKPVPVQPEPQPDAPLKNIRSSLNRRRLRTMLCSFAAALALAAVCGFGWYGYTACDRVSFFDARLQASYQQAENGCQRLGAGDPRRGRISEADLCRRALRGHPLPHSVGARCP